MSKQSQKVQGGSIAVQSGGDTNIHQGVTPADMRQILDAIAAQTSNFAALAEKIADERIADFGQRLIQEFIDPAKARSDAFKDPDFQRILGAGQYAYARSGDPQVRDNLIDLIARRSKEQNRSRLSLTLNDAVERAAVLTANEFAELSFSYLIRYTKHLKISSLSDFNDYLNTHIVPLLSDISREDASYWYLEAQSCARIEMGSVGLHHVLITNYGGALSKGFDRTALEAHLPDGKKNVFDETGLLRPCINDASKLQFAALDREVFKKKACAISLSEDELNNVYNMFHNTMWSEKELIDNLKVSVPDIGLAFDLWNNTSLKNLSLTSVGIAIGHANLVRVAKLDADLSIWIK